MSAPVEVELHGFAHGGEAVGRLPDGRVIFVAHAIPGETVRAEVTTEHKRWARGRLVEVVEASPDRVVAPCPYFGPDRCGGCRLQHIAPARQRSLLRQVVVDQLERLGGITDPPVAEVIPAGEYGYRNRARFGVTAEGDLAFRRFASDELVPISHCLLLDEATSALHADVGEEVSGAAEAEVRSGAAGGAVVTSAAGAKPAVVRGDAVVLHTVGGFEFQVSATSFFQSNAAGAEILLDLVRAAAAAAAGDTALDLYAGVGLFARGLAADGAAVTAVEGARSSAADARRNLHGLARVVQKPVERVVPRMAREGERFDVVVADPPRRGAGAGVIPAIAEVATRTIVVVACDPAALGRDAGLLRTLGWQLVSATPVDQFAQTGHVETVATFTRG